MSLIHHLSGCLMLAGAWLGVSAQTAPTITMYTENYEVSGEKNLFTLGIGSTVDGIIGVDCGSGIVEYEISPANFDYDNQEITSTYIPCTVTSEGRVDIYCYGDVAIDYFNAEGCGLTDIEFADLGSLEILSLRHNSLRSLDLSGMYNATSIDVGDNPFGDSPLIVGGNKPNLLILNIDVIDNMDSAFDLADYPSLMSFDAFDNTSLYRCDPSQCPNLVKLSIDDTNVSSIDLSHNPLLAILNVGGTLIPSIDVTQCPNLTQLFCSALGRELPQEDRMSHLDISNNPNLVYLFCAHNALTEIDLSCNPILQDIYLNDNYLTEIDLSSNPNLLNVAINKNNLDFATLPSDAGWLEYRYSQRPIDMPTSYLVGTPIDFSNKVLRPDTQTQAYVYIADPLDPTKDELVDASLYTFDDGVLTINDIIEGDVYIEFTNSELTAYPMTTTTFKVKGSDTYGQHEYALSFTSPSLTAADQVALSIGIAGATGSTPKKYYIDLGDGTLIEGEATTETMPTAPNFVHTKDVNGTVTVYLEEDASITAFGLDGITLSDIELTKAGSLQTLSLTGTGLQAIDLSYNNMLQTLILTGNHFTEGFTLEGANGALNKNSLSHIDLSNNELPSIYLMVPAIITYLDLSNNNLEDINLTDGERITELNLSHNQLEYLRLSYQSSLTALDASYNKLSAIVLPETNVLQTVDISNNKFTFADLPQPGEGTGDRYIYAPQTQITIADKGMGCDMSALYVTVDNNTTQYTWHDNYGSNLAEGYDYTISGGVTTFLSPAIGKIVSCDVTNASYPELTITTTPMLLAGMPEYVLGQFTTTSGAQSVSLSLGAATEGTTIYIDWGGDGHPTEYVLKPTYTVFTARTSTLAKVKIYSYEPDNDLTIFSMQGARLKDVDLSGMTHLECLSLTSANIDNLVMPKSDSLHEVYLIKNKFTEFDFSTCPSVQALSMEGNSFTEVDLSPLKDLELVNFSSNKLEHITLDNPKLWAIHLTNNSLSEIDLSKVPSAYQITLDNNNLSSIDAEHLAELRVLYLDGNRFTFETLPLPREQWTVYYYANQAPIEVEAVDGQVDLSSQYMINGIPSQYTWLDGTPWIDSDTGELMGYSLIEGEDYVTADGITTFYTDQSNAMCLITNEQYPKVYLTTPELQITAAGITDASTATYADVYVRDHNIVVEAQSGAQVRVYTAEGMQLCSVQCDTDGHAQISNMPTGILIVKVGNYATKVMVN